MGSRSQLASLVAERAVRLLRQVGAADSRRMVRETLATRSADERSATRLLQSAFGGDPRLAYEAGAWRLAAEASAPRRGAQTTEPDRVLLFVEGHPRPGAGFRLETVAALRLRGDDVICACGGDAAAGAYGNRLRRRVREALAAAVPVVHDPPGSLVALERWLGEPLDAPISLRRLARDRRGLRAHHDLRQLAAALGLVWRETGDPLDLAETLDACLQALRHPGERLLDLQASQTSGAVPIDWSRFDFDGAFLRRIPRTPGTYRFYDAENRLLYVGKSNDLSRRIASYFRVDPARRQPRVRRLLERLHRIEYSVSGSDLEALLREAAQIRRERPSGNVQRRVHARSRRVTRLQSILILEPGEPPAVLRAFLIRRGRLVGRVNLGVRGGGLARVRQLLERHFFSAGDLARGRTRGPDVDVEVIARWLAAHRDRVVAFDPTDLPGVDEVVDRLRWFLRQGGPSDPDGRPVIRR